MRPKPHKKKHQPDTRDIYRGYVLTGGDYGSRWYAHNVDTGTELWDSGYVSREEACREIDNLLD